MDIFRRRQFQQTQADESGLGDEIEALLADDEKWEDSKSQFRMYFKSSLCGALVGIFVGLAIASIIIKYLGH